MFTCNKYGRRYLSGCATTCFGCSASTGISACSAIIAVCAIAVQELSFLPLQGADITAEADADADPSLTSCCCSDCFTTVVSCCFPVTVSDCFSAAFCCCFSAAASSCPSATAGAAAAVSFGVSDADSLDADLNGLFVDAVFFFFS